MGNPVNSFFSGYKDALKANSPLQITITGKKHKEILTFEVQSAKREFVQNALFYWFMYSLSCIERYRANEDRCWFQKIMIQALQNFFWPLIDDLLPPIYHCKIRQHNRRYGFQHRRHTQSYHKIMPALYFENFFFAGGKIMCPLRLRS